MEYELLGVLMLLNDRRRRSSGMGEHLCLCNGHGSSEYTCTVRPDIDVSK